jgi:nucleolar protein 12
MAETDQQFHSEMDACNAYIIFAHPHPDRPTNVAPVMNPFEAAAAVLAANGSTFMSRTIRVDKLRLPSAIALETATNALSKRDAWLPSNADPKKSLFIGGLDYAAKEEDVRVLFEELVKSERGASTEKYVTGVRIIRDSATQLGKGFGYIHFKVSRTSRGYYRC